MLRGAAVPIHKTADELESSLPNITDSPADQGALKQIVLRPSVDQRELVERAELTVDKGLVGDCWSDGDTTDNRNQVSLMNVRVLHSIAGEVQRYELAGDNLLVDFDLSERNLPEGAKLLVGKATLELTGLPHTGCHKFEARYGSDAKSFVNSTAGRKLNLRGRYARVVAGGTISVGDTVARHP